MKLYSINTGRFKLDGGAMFGVVPKRMWNKLHPADEENMITLQARCLLVDEGSRKILIDTGMGTKQDEKFRGHFYPHELVSFEESLAEAGFTCEDITDVLITHFHFDHVGGALKYSPAGEIIPTFPNATYWSNELHYAWAFQPNAREAASFLKENFVPLKEQGLLKFVDVEQGVRFSETIQLDFVFGHTEAMMIPNIQTKSGNTLIFTADLLPFHHHVPMPYVMSYDVRPLDTMKEKGLLFEKATAPGHFLFFEHDPFLMCGKLQKNEQGKVVFEGEVSLDDIQ
ncbi:MAG: MBL fold metallo-hydrolase [Saprospiraceae bacterium]|jgi:glyoxylase-like metal-dependent hydrolase (beta-lactamase superfamily II)|nr:MBL fold metallo-hydrolase [Saprospiraceae bacterium]